MPERVTGRAAVDSTFRAVFADVRAHATGGPPFHRLTPVDLRIQPLAPGIVLVTFELRNAERLGVVPSSSAASATPGASCTSTRPTSPRPARVLTRRAPEGLRSRAHEA